jgi:hypothetical protein
METELPILGIFFVIALVAAGAAVLLIAYRLSRFIARSALGTSSSTPIHSRPDLACRNPQCTKTNPAGAAYCRRCGRSLGRFAGRYRFDALRAAVNLDGPWSSLWGMNAAPPLGNRWRMALWQRRMQLRMQRQARRQRREGRAMARRMQREAQWISHSVRNWAANWQTPNPGPPAQPTSGASRPVPPQPTRI